MDRTLIAAIPPAAWKTMPLSFCIEYFIDLMHTAGIWLRIELNVFNIENILKLVFVVTSC